MTRAIQVAAILLVVVLSFGLFGQIGSAGRGTVELGLIAVWLYGWLESDKERPVVFAVSLGVAYDLVSFLPFGYWTATFLLSTLLIGWLKNRYLTVSSFFQAVAVLLLVSFLSSLATSIGLGTFNYLQIMTTALLNCAVGSVIYYLLVIKLKMFQRWMGIRL